MLLELEHLIRLQQLEDRTTTAREQINNIPVRLENLELQIAKRRPPLLSDQRLGSVEEPDSPAPILETRYANHKNKNKN